MATDRDEATTREQIIAEARTWLGTPYHSNALVKGVGVDCATLLIGVYGNCDLIPGFVDPRPYPMQWHLHRNEERYMNIVREFSKEVPAPPERMPKPGDVVMFKMGKVFAHGGIITAWPKIIHAAATRDVTEEDISFNTIGKRALWLVPQVFFSIWE